MDNLSKSLAFLGKSGFINAVVEKNTIKNIKFLPLGTAFLENIRNEWHNKKNELNSYPAIGVEDDEGVNPDSSNKFSFIRSSLLRDNLLHVKSHFQNELPLIIKSENLYTGTTLDGNEEDAKEFQFDILRGTILATNYFFSPSVALEKFYHIQRERKICWMKYSSNPSRYFLSDLVTEENGAGQKLQSVKIKSILDDKNMDVEEIHFVPVAAMNLENESDFVMKDSRLGKSVLPTCIRSEFRLEATACALLLDSIESTRENTLSINRKIAPYQCGIFCFSQDKNISPDLEDLCTHMSNVIRKLGISTLNLQKCHTTNSETLNAEISQMDRIGVPYCLILTSDTLRSGLMRLRSRDSTLSETIHITDVSNYLHKIFNS